MALNPPIEAIPLPLQETNREEHIQRFLTSLPHFGSGPGLQQEQEAVWGAVRDEEQAVGQEEENHMQSTVLLGVSEQDRPAVGQMTEREEDAAQRRRERKTRRREKAAILNPKPPTPPLPRVKPELHQDQNGQLDDEWWEEHRRRKRAERDIPSSTTRRRTRDNENRHGQERSSPSDPETEMKMARVKVKIKASGKGGAHAKEKKEREPKGRIPGMDIIEGYKPATTALGPRLTLKPMKSKKGMFANGKSSDPAVIRHLTGMDEGMKKLIGSQSTSGPSKRMTLNSSPSREDWRDQWRRKGLTTGTNPVIGKGALPPPGNTNSASWPSTLPSSDMSIKNDNASRQVMMVRDAREEGHASRSGIRTIEGLRGRYMYNPDQRQQEFHANSRDDQPDASRQIAGPPVPAQRYVEIQSQPYYQFDHRDSQDLFFNPAPNVQAQNQLQYQDHGLYPVDQARFLPAQAYHQDHLIHPAHDQSIHHQDHQYQDHTQTLIDNEHHYTYPTYTSYEGDRPAEEYGTQPQACAHNGDADLGNFWKTARYPTAPIPSQHIRNPLWTPHEAQAHLDQHPYPYTENLYHLPHHMDSYAQSFPPEAYLTPTPGTLAGPLVHSNHEREYGHQPGYLGLRDFYGQGPGQRHPLEGSASITNLPSPLPLGSGPDPKHISLGEDDVYDHDQQPVGSEWPPREDEMGRIQGQEIAEYGATTDEWKNLWSSRKAYR